MSLFFAENVYITRVMCTSNFLIGISRDEKDLVGIFSLLVVYETKSVVRRLNLILLIDKKVDIFGARGLREGQQGGQRGIF